MTTSGVQEETNQGELEGRLADPPAPQLPPVLSSRGSRFEKGDVVEVLPWEELIGKLDRNGTTDGLPFMPEMVKYCGQELTVTKRLERTCEDLEGGMRRIRNVVFLNELRCDGSEHGGCQKGCCFLWKDAWLRTPKAPSRSEHDPAESFPFPYKFEDQRYSCQATELVRATENLSALDIRSYFRDLRAKTYSPLEMLRLAFHALVQRMRFHLAGRSHRFLEGDRTKTPVGNLNLQAGEWVVREESRGNNPDAKQRGKEPRTGVHRWNDPLLWSDVSRPHSAGKNDPRTYRETGSSRRHRDLGERHLSGRSEPARGMPEGELLLLA